MIYELLATALLACFLGAGNYKEEPKRVITPTQYQTYTIEIYWGNNTHFGYIESSGGGHEIAYQGFGTEVSFTSDYAKVSFNPEAQGEGAGTPFTISVALTFEPFNDEERFEASFEKVQENTTLYTTSVGGLYWDSSDVDDSVEMFLNFEGVRGTNYYASFSVTFPMVYKIDFETFGIIEGNSFTYVAQNGSTSKLFNGSTSGFGYFFFVDGLRSANLVSRSNQTNDFDITIMDGYDDFFARQMKLDITNVRDDCTFKVSAIPYVNGLRGQYDEGYTAGLAEGQTPVSWIKATFDGIAGFFNIQVFPFVTLGFLCFAPLIVVAIVAILRIIKHD